MKRPKAFDCVEMMHKGQEAEKKRMEGMTREEILEYCRRQDKEAKAEIEQLRARLARKAKRD